LLRLTHKADRHIQHLADGFIAIAEECQFDRKRTPIFARVTFLGKKSCQIRWDGDHNRPLWISYRTHERRELPNEETIFYNSGRIAISAFNWINDAVRREVRVLRPDKNISLIEDVLRWLSVLKHVAVSNGEILPIDKHHDRLCAK